MIRSTRNCFQIRSALAAFISLCAFTPAAHGQTKSPLPPPNPFRYVNDYAGVIDSSASNRMEGILRSLKTSGDIEFAVVTVKTTGEQDIFDYSLALARGWGVGSKEGEKNGLLLLVAIDDRKYFMQVSRHLEGDLPDGLVGEIGRRMREPFRRGDYSAGLMTAVQTVVSTLAEKRGFTIGDVDRSYAYHPPEQRVRQASGLPIGALVKLFLIVLFVIIFLVASRSRGGGWLSWLLLGMLFNAGGGRSSSSGWTSGGFGGSSGGSFGGFGGGGDFGGGGAGGSW
jgi:uncharacterized protein